MLVIILITDTTDEGDHENDEGLSSATDESGDETHERSNIPEKDEGAAGKSGLADVMAKILNKKAPEKKSAVLAKAMTDRQIIIKRKQKKAEETEESKTATSVKKSYDSDSSDDEYDPHLTKEQRLKVDPMILLHEGRK